jgi:hypothetical protein
MLAYSSDQRAPSSGELQHDTYRYLGQFYSAIQEAISTESIPQVIYGCLAMIVFELSNVPRSTEVQEQPSLSATEKAKRVATHLFGLVTALRSFQVILRSAPTSINLMAFHYLWCIVLSTLENWDPYPFLYRDGDDIMLLVFCECYHEIYEVSRIVTRMLCQGGQLTFDKHTPQYGVNRHFCGFIHNILPYYMYVWANHVQNDGKDSRARANIGSALECCIDFVIHTEGLVLDWPGKFGRNTAALAVLLKHLLFSNKDIVHAIETTDAALALFSRSLFQSEYLRVDLSDLACLFWTGIVLNSATNLEGQLL